jgi:3D (Asp-Asp-Asp) domain-containing protein
VDKKMNVYRLITSLGLIIVIINHSANADINDQTYVVGVVDYLSLNNQITSIQQQHDSYTELTEINKQKKTEQILDLFNLQLNGIDKTILAQTINLPIKKLEVEATAYTSHAAQTDSTPIIAAWGDKLKPNTKAIAVSPDLLTEYGLKYRSKVMIKGLSGEFLVLDKMNKRWRKRIDIYMGINHKAALKWGRKKVELSWKQEAT